MKSDRCCSRCRAVPGACGLGRNCKCHRIDDLRFAQDADWTEMTPAQVAAAVEQASKEEAKRMSDWAAWR